MTTQLTVNPLASLENILEKISKATNGKVEFTVNRKSLVKSEVTINVQTGERVEYVPRPVTKEVVVYKKVYDKKPNASSKYLNVYRKSGDNNWAYKFQYKGQKYRKQGFKTEKEAALAYNAHAVQVMGNLAKLNEIDIDTPVAN